MLNERRDRQIGASNPSFIIAAVAQSCFASIRWVRCEYPGSVRASTCEARRAEITMHLHLSLTPERAFGGCAGVAGCAVICRDLQPCVPHIQRASAAESGNHLDNSRHSLYS
jgi:hypothetical protein